MTGFARAITSASVSGLTQLSLAQARMDDKQTYADWVHAQAAAGQCSDAQSRPGIGGLASVVRVKTTIAFPNPPVPNLVVQRVAIRSGHHFEGDFGFGRFAASGFGGQRTFVTPANQEMRLSGEAEEPVDVICVAIDWVDFQSASQKLLQSPVDDLGVLHSHADRVPAVGVLVDQVWKEFQSQRFIRPLVIEALLHRMTLLLLHQSGRMVPGTKANSYLSPLQFNRVLEFLSARLSDPITLEQLASEVGVSQFHFSRLFKQTVGVSPMAFIKRLRIERACLLLSRRADTSVGQIAIRCGFYDHSHLTRVFKSTVGMTPTQYRRSRVGRSLDN